ncbi:hypothetical protein ACWGPW_28800 [Paenibacillus chitinolyticus]
MPTVDELIFQAQCGHRDNKAREAGFLPLLTGEVYECQYNRSSHVFVIGEDGKWSAWRETWQKGERKSISHKGIAEYTSFEQALQKAKRYVEFVGGGANRKRK